MDQLIAAAIIFPSIFGVIYVLMVLDERHQKRTGEWHSFEGDKMRQWAHDHWVIRPMTGRELSEADEDRDGMAM